MRYEEWIDAIDSADDPRALRQAMVRAIEALQIPIFAYRGWTGRDAPPMAIGTSAWRWRHRYLNVRYDKIDPVPARAQIARLPFWWDMADFARTNTPAQSRMFDEAAGFGIERGITIPVRRAEGATCTVNFSSNERASSFKQNVKEHRNLLHLLGLHFDAGVVRTIESPSNGLSHRLTRREIGCLQWAARGKSTLETAMIFAISRRTVVFHLENAKRKLEVSTVRQAIVEALLQNAITR